MFSYENILSVVGLATRSCHQPSNFGSSALKCWVKAVKASKVHQRKGHQVTITGKCPWWGWHGLLDCDSLQASAPGVWNMHFTHECSCQQLDMGVWDKAVRPTCTSDLSIPHLPHLCHIFHLWEALPMLEPRGPPKKYWRHRVDFLW